MTDTPQTPQIISKTRTLEQALADFRDQRDREQRAAEQQAEAEKQARREREAETARRVGRWLIQHYGVVVPTEFIQCAQEGDEYSVFIRVPSSSNYMSLNGRVAWSADELIVSTRLDNLKRLDFTWHAISKGAYIDAEFLVAADYAFPWPVEGGQP